MKKTLICFLGLALVGCGQVAEPETPVVDEMPAVEVEAVSPFDIVTTPKVVAPGMDTEVEAVEVPVAE